MKIAYTLLAVITVALAAISAGHDPLLYTSPWMVTLWTVMASASVAVIIRRRLVRRPVLMLLHVSLLVILAGGAVTHFTGVSGGLHLRLGDGAATHFVADDGHELPLPVALSLESFDVVTYSGTGVPSDYVSVLADGDGVRHSVSVNRPASLHGYRLLQGTYDSDARGVTLSVSRDAWGTGITYAGYLMLAVSMLMFFFVRGTSWRVAMVSLRRTALMVTVMCAFAGITVSAAPHDRLARVAVNHNGRVCPMETLACDFARDVTGARGGYGGFSPMEIMEGYLFEFGSWKDKPVIKIKNGRLRELLGISGDRARYSDFYAATSDGRLDIEDPQVRQMYMTDIRRFESINMLVGGALLKVFPVEKGGGEVTWYAPVDRLPHELDSDRWMFVRKFWGLYNERVIRGDEAGQASLLDALARYQFKETGGAMPPAWRIELELVYNSCGSAFPPAIAALAVGLLLFIICMMNPRLMSRRIRLCTVVAATALTLWLTALIAVRWLVSGYIPMTNGYETMVFMAWCPAMAGALSWRIPVMQPMALIGSGLALAVAAMSDGGSSVAGLMPVLSSPLLSVHVVCVMAAYALMLLMALAGVTALCRRGDAAIQLMALSRVMLYPALMLLTAGIFIGAVWADVSWGRYWGWDPKEVWALITMLVYSAIAHPRLAAALNHPRVYHACCVAAFLCVLITYFGVNFILGGLHSYA